MRVESSIYSTNSLDGRYRNKMELLTKCIIPTYASPTVKFIKTLYYQFVQTSIFDL